MFKKTENVAETDLEKANMTKNGNNKNGIGTNEANLSRFLTVTNLVKFRTNIFSKTVM